MRKIDKLDERIIEFLLREGPVANIVIANGLKTSEATVRRRRTRLEKEGFIKFVCAADPVKLGYVSAAIVGIQVEGEPHRACRIGAPEARRRAVPRAEHGRL